MPVTNVIMKSKVNGRSESDYDRTIDMLFLYKESLELLTSANQTYTGVKGNENLKNKLEIMSTNIKDLEIPDNVSEKESFRLNNAVMSIKKDISSKLNCVQQLRGIANLENVCSEFSLTIDKCSVDISQKNDVKDVSTDNIIGFFSPSSQDCISANRESWKWIKTLHNCTFVHLNNAADFQQFFHEINAVSPVMISDLTRLHDSFQFHHLKGDLKDAQKLLRELHDITVSLKQWRMRTNDLWSRANELVPVNLRISSIQSPLPARSLCNYSTSDLTVREHEDILILDNKDKTCWTVRNCQGKESTMPSAAVLIPGPCLEALKKATQVRLQLLAEWTQTLKRVGHRLICFLLLVFKSNFDDEKIKTMTSIDLEDKEDLMEIMKYLEDTLAVHWTEHEGFSALQERLLAVRLIMDDKRNMKNFSSKHKSHNQLVLQCQILEELMRKYKELWCRWDAYKVSLETSQSPDMMLILEQWEEIKFVKPEDFAKYWKSHLCLTEEERSMCGLRMIADKNNKGLGESIDENDMQSAMNSMLGIKEIRMASFGEDGYCEEGTENIDEDEIDKVDSNTTEGAHFGVATERKSADTVQLSSAEMEEKKTFVIRAIIDTSTGKEISLQDATDREILIPEEGMYYNVKEKTKIPIPVAMSQGLIKVEFTSTKRSEEKKSSVGIITVQTIKQPSRLYQIISVTDIKTGTKLSLKQAIERKIINEANETFKNTKTRKQTTILEAVENKYIEIKYDENENEVAESITTSQIYAVRAVMDVAKQTTLNFAEALRRGIVDKTSGTFSNTLTYEKMSIPDAIIKGFLKAKIIEDISMVEIDPDHEITAICHA